MDEQLVEKPKGEGHYQLCVVMLTPNAYGNAWVPTLVGDTIPDTVEGQLLTVGRAALQANTYAANGYVVVADQLSAERNSCEWQVYTTLQAVSLGNCSARICVMDVAAYQRAVAEADKASPIILATKSDMNGLHPH